MSGYSGPNITDDGLVLSLGGASTKSFKGEATVNEFVDDTWTGDGTNQTGLTKGATLVTNKKLKYKNYTTYLWTPGSSLNCYLNGADISSSRTSTVWTFSCYVKREDGAAITSLNVYMYYPSSDGSASGTIESVGNGWYRVSRTRTGTDNYIALAGFTGFTSGYRYYLSAPQLEKKSYATTATEINSTRGSTVATGGGWKNRVGSSDGELVNGVKESDDGGGSLVFDGTNDYVNAPVTKAASCTFSCWAKTTTVAGLPMLFNAGPSGSGPDLFFYSGSISWNTWNGNGNPFATIPSSVTDGNWHHYVVVNDASSNAKLYYDGKLLGTATYRNASANTNLTIGGNTGSYMWNGSISNFMLHNKVLTAAEVKKNFNAFRRRFGL